MSLSCTSSLNRCWLICSPWVSIWPLNSTTRITQQKMRIQTIQLREGILKSLFFFWRSSSIFLLSSDIRFSFDCAKLTWRLLFSNCVYHSLCQPHFKRRTVVSSNLNLSATRSPSTQNNPRPTRSPTSSSRRLDLEIFLLVNKSCNFTGEAIPLG